MGSSKVQGGAVSQGELLYLSKMPWSMLQSVLDEMKDLLGREVQQRRAELWAISDFQLEVWRIPTLQVVICSCVGISLDFACVDMHVERRRQTFFIL